MVDKPQSMSRSEEADARGLELGRRQGEALGETIRHMIGDIAQRGAEVRSGEYLVGYAVEKAEGVYVARGGKLQWEEPGEENLHIEAWVRDAADGRFLPGLKLRVSVTAEDGREIGTHEHPLLWHPYLYHYGRNWKLPADGRYRLKISFEAPGFPRHDRKNGKRFTSGCEVVFDDVKVETGKG